MESPTKAGAKKTINKVRAALKARHGPAAKDQARAPIADAIARYWDDDVLSFSIPAHGGARGPAPEFTKWAGRESARADLPTSHGIDTRDRAFQVQATAQELFAEATGATQVLFSTNGSSLNVRVAVMSVVGPGETLVMARNGHKSAFAGLALSGARPVYVEPYYDEQLEVAHAVLVDDVVKAVEAHPEAKAVMIFTPSYYGASADIKAIADACHERDLPLVTDDAWALDYALSGHPDLPEGALARGSDLAIGSVHRRLAAEVPELRVIEPDLLNRTPGVAGVDPTHVLIETAQIGLTGYRALDWLRFERYIDVELVDHRRIMPLITFAHGEAEIDRLVRGLRDLVDALSDEDGSDIPTFPNRPEMRTEAPMLPRDAFFAKTELVKFDQAAGRISAELITPYPPGIPAVAPGELYGEENLTYLQAFVEAGGFVEGAADPTLQHIRVVAQ